MADIYIIKYSINITFTSTNRQKVNQLSYIECTYRFANHGHLDRVVLYTSKGFSLQLPN